MMLLNIVAIVGFMVHCSNGSARDTIGVVFGCTSTDESTSTCIIDPYIHFPDGYASYINDNNNPAVAADLVCDSAYRNCQIHCTHKTDSSSCGVANKHSSKYMRIYCPLLSSNDGQPEGSCDIQAFYHHSMKGSRIYGGSYNTLTLTFGDLSAPERVTSPSDGGNLVINSEFTSYQFSGKNLILTISSGTNDVILNCDDNNLCVSSKTNIDATQIKGELAITAGTITDSVIICPNDPNNPNTKCNIDCTQTCTNTQIYTKDGYVKLG